MDTHAPPLLSGVPFPLEAGLGVFVDFFLFLFLFLSLFLIQRINKITRKVWNKRKSGHSGPESGAFSSSSAWCDKVKKLGIQSEFPEPGVFQFVCTYMCTSVLVLNLLNFSLNGEDKDALP